LDSAEPPLRIVVLAGGMGSRFWPASTPDRPKPLLGLGESGRPLISETVDRALAVVSPRDVAILAGPDLQHQFRSALPELGPDQFWSEPRARGTGPVLAWAAHRIHRETPEAVMISLHADHLIRPSAALTDLLPKAADLASREDLLLLVAVSPDRPETGYGYLRPGSSLPSGKGLDAFRVERFVEKPDAETALEYISQGYLWNSGIFVLPVRRFLAEIRLRAPELGVPLHLLDQGDDEGYFDAVPNISVDEAVLERSDQVGAVRATFAWDDVGNWEAVTRTRSPDADGNWIVGDGRVMDASGSIVWAEDGPVVLFGVDDLVVVRAQGITFVTSREAVPRMKALHESLPPGLRAPTAGDPPPEGSA
jgi:mannose-1-phosphate guanylyltransferase